MPHNQTPQLLLLIRHANAAAAEETKGKEKSVKLTGHEGHAVDGRCCQQQQEGEAVTGPKHVHQVSHHHTRRDGTTHSCNTGITHIVACEVQALPDNWQQRLLQDVHTHAERHADLRGVGA